MFTAIYYWMYHQGPLSALEYSVLTIGCLFVAFSISFSRVYSGMHCPTDILGGYAVGLVILFFSVFYMNTLDEWILGGDNGEICAFHHSLFLSRFLNFFSSM